MSEKHFNDLCELQEHLADIQQMFEWHMLGIQKSIEKLRKLHADIRQRLGQIDVPIPKD